MGGLRLWGHHGVLGLTIATLVFAIDQAFKLTMIDGIGLQLGHRVPVLPILDVVFVRNPGISYGLFPVDTAGGQMLLGCGQIIAAILLWLWLARTESRVTAFALALVIGGALGNALDRFLYGAVADFFLLHFNALGAEFTWYVFNLADVAIVAGVVVLLYESLFHSRGPAADSLSDLRKE